MTTTNGILPNQILAFGGEPVQQTFQNAVAKFPPATKTKPEPLATAQQEPPANTETNDNKPEQETANTETEPPAPEGKSLLATLLENSSVITTKAAQEKIHFAPPIMTRTGKENIIEPIIYANTLAMITGLAGVHKSRLAEIILAVFLAIADNFYDLLGLKAKGDGCVACIIDTERNLETQLPFAIQQIRRLAGFPKTEELSNLEYTSLVNLRRADRQLAMREFFQHVRTKHKGKHLIMLIDVLSDLCEDFNNPRFALPLVDELNDMINRYDCTIIAVLHQNPSGFNDKSRGHLGSESENKASTILTIGKHQNLDGVFAVRCKKQRSDKPFGTFYVKFCDIHKTLVEEDKATVAAQSALVIDWWAVFGEDDEGLPASIVHERLQKQYNCQKRRAQQYVEDAVSSGDIISEGKAKARKLKPAIKSSAKSENQDEPLEDE
jgi:hypothetical protein